MTSHLFGLFYGIYGNQLVFRTRNVHNIITGTGVLLPMLLFNYRVFFECLLSVQKPYNMPK